MERAEAEFEVGADHIRKILDLSRRLYGSEDLLFRIAPSVVVRSEAELFGLSFPRFALRAEIQNSDGSFFNLRRLQIQAKAIKQALNRYTKKEIPDHSEWEKYTNSLSTIHDNILNKNTNCAADSFLIPPQKFLDEKYFILTCDLLRAYGENGDCKGVPFVSHLVIFGGGMCAQAVAFQATALWENIAEGIHGIAEISFLADEGDSEWFDLGGMNPLKLLRYFKNKNVGLNASYQKIDFSNKFNQLASSQPANTIQEFGSALHSYVDSGIPVILPIDLGRMCGVHTENTQFTHESIMVRNELSLTYNYKDKPLKERNHAILVVGTSKIDRGNYDFLVNDPATYPFLKASAIQLFESRRYVPGCTDKLGALTFIPVTPKEVCLPLYSSPDALTFGLTDISGFVKKYGKKYICELPSLNSKSFFTNTLGLFNFAERFQKSSRFGNYIDRLPTNLVDLIVESQSKGEIDKKWHWIELVDHAFGNDQSVWVWDATENAPTTSSINSSIIPIYLKFCAVKHNDVWNKVYVNCPSNFTALPSNHLPQPIQPLQNPTQTKVNLKPSLITSFSTGGYYDLDEHWENHDDISCDLYMVMNRDIANILELPEGLTDAVEAMASIANDDDRITKIARNISNQRYKTIAFSSFVPQVTSDPSDSNAKHARDCIKFLARLAIKLYDIKGHFRIIELVAGSRIDDINESCKYPMSINDKLHHKRAYLAKVMSEHEAAYRLLNTIDIAIDQHLSNELVDRKISFAVELEPGPLFALRDWKTLLHFSQLINSRPKLSKILGLNLDIAHWRIALGDDCIPNIESNDIIKNRIVHAHISGHHKKAHFGDLHLTSLNSIQDFAPWIRLVKRLASEKRDSSFPEFSGFISHEFEAAKEVSQVWESVYLLDKLLKSD